ncbi:nuclear transport factor 2 family protein [Gordonia sp. CPCC 206044]|uniref:nuclear transport factor 2 family protein n=1 Tax=Gordonia sp. CPCC 206044 TaxID=3140793 RepID=UPI003AF3E362
MSIREEIENVLARYALAYDSGDMAAVEKVFASDAVLTLEITDGASVGPLNGIDEIMGLYRGAHESQTDQRRHITTNLAVEPLADDTVKTTSYLLITSAENGTLTPLSTGVYEDEWVRGGESWQLRRRHIALDLPY